LLIQIPASVLKFIYFGRIVEGRLIGTFTHDEGSVTTVFTLITMSFIATQYYHYRKQKHLFLLLGFVLFGLLNGKRALVILAPMILVINHLMTLFSNNRAKFNSFLRNGVIIILLILIILPLIISMTPSLNPDHKIGGRVDLEHTYNYIVKYNTTERKDDVNRSEAPKYFYNLLKQQSIVNLLFGNGPGDVVKSRFLPGGENPILTKYGIRYGGRTALVFFLLQTGLLGTFFYFWFHVKLGMRMIKIYISERRVGRMLFSKGSILMIIVFFIDSLTYSKSMLTSKPIMMFYLFCIGIQINKNIVGDLNIIKFKKTK